MHEDGVWFFVASDGDPSTWQSGDLRSHGFVFSSIDNYSDINGSFKQLENGLSQWRERQDIDTQIQWTLGCPDQIQELIEWPIIRSRLKSISGVRILSLNGIKSSSFSNCWGHKRRVREEEDFMKLFMSRWRRRWWPISSGLCMGRCPGISGWYSGFCRDTDGISTLVFTWFPRIGWNLWLASLANSSPVQEVPVIPFKKSLTSECDQHKTRDLRSCEEVEFGHHCILDNLPWYKEQWLHV